MISLDETMMRLDKERNFFNLIMGQFSFLLFGIVVYKKRVVFVWVHMGF